MLKASSLGFAKYWVNKAIKIRETSMASKVDMMNHQKQGPKDQNQSHLKRHNSRLPIKMQATKLVCKREIRNDYINKINNIKTFKSDIITKNSCIIANFTIGI